MTSAGVAIKQIVDFNKNAFDNTFDAIMNIGEQNEKMLRAFIDHTWLPDESKRVVFEWINNYRSGWMDFKKAADESYKTMAKYLGPTPTFVLPAVNQEGTTSSMRSFPYLVQSAHRDCCAE